MPCVLRRWTNGDSEELEVMKESSWNERDSNKKANKGQRSQNQTNQVVGRLPVQQ